MCRIIGLLNVLGLIFLSFAASAFRFPSEGRGRSMVLRTSLVPPPPRPPRGIRHGISGRMLQHRPAGAMTLRTAGPPRPPTQASSGWRWPRPVQGRSSPHNSPTMQHHISQRQPRKLQWEPPVRTLQQLGQDIGSASSAQTVQQTTGPEDPSNHSPSISLAPEEVTNLCQRCDLLISMAATACCSAQGLCCDQHTPQHIQSQLQQQPQRSYYPPQTPQVDPSQFHHQRNSHQQGHIQVPAHQIFHTSSVNIYNGQSHPMNQNPGHAEPPYEIIDSDYQDYQDPENTDEDFPVEDILLQEGSEPTRDRRSSLGDLVAGAAISMISMAVRMAAEGGLGAGDPQREHRMIG